jgi:hypothetical protein
VNQQNIAITMFNDKVHQFDKFKFHSKNLSIYNFQIFLIPQGTSAYHISHYNMVINFIWVH